LGTVLKSSPFAAMHIIIRESHKAMSLEAARALASLIRRKPGAVIGLATGGTPIPLYEELIRLHREERLDFSRVTTFNLDEYLGLAVLHPGSFHHYMKKRLFDHVNLGKDRIRMLSGRFAADETDAISRHCEEYEQAIAAAGGIDLQILGIGANGHIGFNEPGSSLGSRTRLVTLQKKTRLDNAVFFDDDPDKVPHHAVTMGIGTILEAKSLLVLALGQHKAEIVRKALEGPVTAMVPASALQLHRNAIIILDKEAASLLTRDTDQGLTPPI